MATNYVANAIGQGLYFLLDVIHAEKVTHCAQLSEVGMAGSRLSVARAAAAGGAEQGGLGSPPSLLPNAASAPSGSSENPCLVFGVFFLS